MKSDDEKNDDQKDDGTRDERTNHRWIDFLFFHIFYCIKKLLILKE